MNQMRGRIELKKQIYPHNDLDNAAFHLFQQITKNQAENREGIKLEIMAYLVILAFSFEAKINFIGDKVVPNWNERACFDKKIQRICACTKYDLDKSVRPFKTIYELQKLRNSLAHAKPIKIEEDETIDITPNYVLKDLDLSSNWESKLTIEFSNQCAKDIDEVWEGLLREANIQPSEAITQGESL